MLFRNSKSIQAQCKAQYGFHATATVNAVTRSGTNEFHGNLFEFVRNYKFNARDAFATKRDTYKRNQFGGVIGGPIKKDKLFFFGGYQRTSLRSDGVQNTAVRSYTRPCSPVISPA
jgi:hypothetical protein